MEKNTVCLSVKALHYKYGENLTHCTISTEDDGYFDLQTLGVGTVCMDGEECEVVKNDGFDVTLVNREGESDYEFLLTKEEFEVASFL